MIYSYLVGDITYSLFDAGVANLFGLETLRHGTNPTNNLSIRFFGGNPKDGGKASGSTAQIQEYDCKNYFYVFKDDEHLPTAVWNVLKIKGLDNRMLPRLHAALSGFNFVYQKSSPNQPLIIRCALVFSACISGLVSLLVSPTLRFRFSEIDPTRLENDPDYKGQGEELAKSAAYRTTKKVEPWRIGLLGSLLTGINSGWFSRVRAHPFKLLTGIVQITCAVAITILCVKTLIACPVLAIPAIAGALLA